MKSDITNINTSRPNSLPKESFCKLSPNHYIYIYTILKKTTYRDYFLMEVIHRHNTFYNKLYSIATILNNQFGLRDDFRSVNEVLLLTMFEFFHPFQMGLCTFYSLI